MQTMLWRLLYKKFTNVWSTAKRLPHSFFDKFQHAQKFRRMLAISIAKVLS